MGIEERVTQLETLLAKKTAEYDNTLAGAKLEIQRLQAAIEIQSVMGRYAFYYSAQRFDLINELWSHQEDASFDMGFGAALINRADDYSRRAEGESRVGLFRIHALSTPVVAVAEDGLTARATWISPGIDTDVKNGKTTCNWCWIKYGADFIKEDGEWKFWHVTAYGLFNTDYYTSWGDSPPKPLKRTIPADLKGPNAIGRNFIPAERDDWTYAADRLPVLEPVPPLPYKTWKDVSPGYRTWQ